MKYIHELKNWPHFQWEEAAVNQRLIAVRYRQGRLLGRMDGLGFRFKEAAVLHTLTQDVMKSSEIEGEKLQEEQVRSSIARRLGMDIAGLVPSDRDVEGVVEMMLDATQHYTRPLTRDRLFGWHSSLFPSGRSGMYKITTGNWRKATGGPMQVVSGPLGKEKVHYEAPDSKRLNSEMAQFLKWFNNETEMDAVLKSAIAHFWFVTIHPFDDGNGRIARAIADLQLARSDGSTQRFYSVSTQIRKERKLYYEVLEKTQKGNLDITQWLLWYLDCVDSAITNSDKNLKEVLGKATFWERHAAVPLNERQKVMINKLIDGFHGKLNSSKWATITRVSHDTALRDINDLLQKGLLLKEAGGSKNTSYVLNAGE